MYSFHCTIHAVTGDVCSRMARGAAGGVGGLPVVPPTGLLPLHVTFDEAVVGLARLERMFVEPDGAFVWAGSAANKGAEWQVDGQLHDQGDRLWCAELKGRCPRGQFDQLLAAFGWPAQAVVFQTIPEGEFLVEVAFRARAEDERRLPNDE